MECIVNIQQHKPFDITALNISVIDVCIIIYLIIPLFAIKKKALDEEPYKKFSCFLSLLIF